MRKAAAALGGVSLVLLIVASKIYEPTLVLLLSFVFGLAAIVLGAIGLRKEADSEGFLISRTPAVVGLLFGGFTVACLALIFVVAQHD
jgi:uncharacterized membrane protein